MIKIELTFSSMDELNTFVRRNVSVATIAQEMGATPLPQIQPEKLDKPAEQPKAEAPKEQPKVEPAATTSSEKPDESAAPGVTYDDLKTVIMSAIAKGKTALLKEVCAACGVKTFQGTTDPALWAKAKALIEAGL